MIFFFFFNKPLMEKKDEVQPTQERYGIHLSKADID